MSSGTRGRETSPPKATTPSPSENKSGNYIISLPAVAKNPPNNAPSANLSVPPLAPEPATVSSPKISTVSLENNQLPWRAPDSSDAYRLLTEAMPFHERIVGDVSNAGDSYVPSEQDYQDHRKASYLHMHQPLQPLELVRTPGQRTDSTGANESSFTIPPKKHHKEKEPKSAQLGQEPTALTRNVSVPQTVYEGEVVNRFTLDQMSPVHKVSSPSMSAGEQIERKVSFHKPLKDEGGAPKKASFTLGAMSTEELEQTNVENVGAGRDNSLHSNRPGHSNGAEFSTSGPNSNRLLDDIRSHRTDEYPGLRQHQIEPQTYSMRRSNSYDSHIPKGMDSSAGPTHHTDKHETTHGQAYAKKRAISTAATPDATSLARRVQKVSTVTSPFLHLPGGHLVKPVFVQMNKLVFHQRYQQWHWQEVARWIYQEENYYEADNSFTVAHSSVLSFEAIITLQKHLEGALISLDKLKPTSIIELVNSLVDEFVLHGMCSLEEKVGIRDTLLLYHKQVGEKYTKNEVKALSSVVSTPNMLQLLGDEGLHHHHKKASVATNMSNVMSHKSYTVGRHLDDPKHNHYSRQTSYTDEKARSRQNSVDGNNFSRHRQNSVDGNNLSRQRSLADGDGLSSGGAGGSSIWAPIIPQHHFRNRLAERLPPHTETAMVQVGIARYLKKPLCAFVRLAEGLLVQGVTEVATVPIRFLFLLLVPMDYPVDPTEVGRCFSTLLIHKDFRWRAYAAEYPEEIISGVASALTSTVVIPLSKHITKDTLSGMMEQILNFKHELELREHMDREWRRRSSSVFDSHHLDPLCPHARKVHMVASAFPLHNVKSSSNNQYLRIRKFQQRAAAARRPHGTLLGMCNVLPTHTHANIHWEEQQMLLPFTAGMHRLQSVAEDSNTTGPAGLEALGIEFKGDEAPQDSTMKVPAFQDPGVDGVELEGVDDSSESKPKKSCGQKCRTCIGYYPFYNVIMDVTRGMRRRYLSDFVDAFKPVAHIPIVFTGSFFVYFTCLAPAVTFGALLQAQVNRDMTVALTIFSSGIAVLIMVLFGGQPFFIPGPTGPAYIIETVAASFAKSLNADVSSLRFYIGLYTSILGILLHCVNAPRIVRYLRNSTAEIFNAFIAFFFLLKALFSIFRPVPLSQPSLIAAKNCSVDNHTYGNCTLHPVRNCSDATKNSTLLASGNFVCFSEWLVMSQQACGIVLAVIMLFVCLFLVEIKRGRYLRRRARFILGSMNVPIGIIITTVFAYTIFMAYEVPKLNIPLTIDPATLVAIPKWNVTFSAAVGGNGMFQGYAIVLAVCLTLIVFTESAMTSVIVASPMRKLVKPPCYSLDLFIMLVVFPVLSGCLGWPFMSGAVVRAFVHTIAMTKWDDKTPPGVPHKLIGAAEQRVSGLIVGTLTSLSVLLGVILRLIPLHAMFGMFLYMGIMGLRELLMKRRLITLLKRQKHWSDHDHLRGIPQGQMAVFVLTLWFFCLVMVALNVVSEFASTATWTAIIFPAIVIIYMATREFIMPRIKWLAPYLEVMDKLPSVALVPPKIVKKTHVEPMGSTPELEAAGDGVSGEGSRKVSTAESTPHGDAYLVTHRPHGEVTGPKSRSVSVASMKVVEEVASDSGESFTDEPLDKRDVEFFYRTVSA